MTDVTRASANLPLTCSRSGTLQHRGNMRLGTELIGCAEREIEDDSGRPEPIAALGREADRYRDNPFAALADTIRMRGLAPAIRMGADLRSVEHLGSLIRQRRLELGFTQNHLARLASVGRRFIVDVEGGKETVRTVELLRACAAVGLIINARVQNVEQIDRAATDQP